MPNIFLISDTHFGHANCLNFMRSDGVTPLRPFSCVEEMDEVMIENWNNTVHSCDKVYHLGDVAFRNATSFDTIMSRLRGEKVLIKGNHDKFKLSVYARHFKDVRGSHQFDGLLLTHIPTHVGSLGRWPTNCHGHTHANLVELSPHHPDPRYFNVSVECIDYTPISLETIKSEIKKRI